MTSSQPDFATLRDAHVVPRTDLDASRHIYQGSASYVLRDPISFQSHRLNQREYRVLASLSAESSLADTFAGLVKFGVLNEGDEEQYYGLIVDFQQLGLLSQTTNGGAKLYARYSGREKQANKLSPMKVMFLRVPLWNPDRFLQNTIGLATYLFSPVVVALWAVWILAAVATVANRWSAFVDPLTQSLATSDLIFMWVTLLGLKIVHEFGHAYACKRYGGNVPEMGAFFLMFNPCAYVDASAAWGFPRRWHRVVVSFGGMYFESYVAALAVFIWAFADSAQVSACAHQVVVMASLVTVIFNLNPLMKYDGYFIVCDLTGVPNLKHHADVAVRATVKKYLLGIPRLGRPNSSWILAYGVASALYKTSIVLGIATAIAIKVPKVGLGLAVFYCGSALIGVFTRAWRYLLTDPETAEVRHRAVIAGAVATCLILAGVAIVPAPIDNVAGGYVGNYQEFTFRFEEPVVVEEVHSLAGDTLQQDYAIASCSSRELSEAFSANNAAVSKARQEIHIGENDPPKERVRRQNSAQNQVRRRTFAASRVDALELQAPFDGHLVQGPNHRDLGRWFEPNEPVATMVRGKRVVRAYVDETAFAWCLPEVGDTVACQFREAPGRAYSGVVENVLPAETRTLPTAALAHTAGGDLIVDPVTNSIRGNVYELQIRLEDSEALKQVHYGSLVAVRLKRRFQPIGWWAAQQVMRFFNASRIG